jgi:hypothetical protein
MIQKLNGARAGAALAIAGVVTAAVFAVGTARAEPVVTQGIGTSSCNRIIADVKPAEGLSNPVNVMLYAWVQGYISAANIALLEDQSMHVDMSTIDGGRVLALVVEFCKANPDGKAVAMVDEMIRRTAKIKTKWEPGTVAWDE